MPLQTFYLHHMELQAQLYAEISVPGSLESRKGGISPIGSLVVPTEDAATQRTILSKDSSGGGLAIRHTCPVEGMTKPMAVSRQV